MKQYDLKINCLRRGERGATGGGVRMGRGRRRGGGVREEGLEVLEG